MVECAGSRHPQDLPGPVPDTEARLCARAATQRVVYPITVTSQPCISEVVWQSIREASSENRRARSGVEREHVDAGILSPRAHISADVRFLKINAERRRQADWTGGSDHKGDQADIGHLLKEVQRERGRDQRPENGRGHRPVEEEKLPPVL